MWVRLGKPVSGILSWAAIYLGPSLPAASSGLPGAAPMAGRGGRDQSRRLGGQPPSSCLTLHRAGFARPPRRRGAGALLPHLFTLAGPLARTWAVCFLLHFPWGFPPWPLASALPCGVPTFLKRFLGNARGHLACRFACQASHSFIIPAAPGIPNPVFRADFCALTPRVPDLPSRAQRFIMRVLTARPRAPHTVRPPAINP